MGEVIDLNPVDDDCVLIDDEGRKNYLFTCSYKDKKLKTRFALQIWAYNMKDAERRVRAIKRSLRLDGQVYSQGEIDHIPEE